MKLLKLFLFSLLFLMAACQQEPRLHDTAGHALRFSDFHGKWVFVNYWASWCEPCRYEIPELNAFYQKHHLKDAVILGVNYDHAVGDELSKLVANVGIHYPNLREDPATMLGIGPVNIIPATYVFGPDGKLKIELLGQQTVAKLEQFIQQGS